MTLFQQLEDDAFSISIMNEIDNMVHRSYVQKECIVDKPITENEVAEIVKCSKRGKAPGPDKVTNEHLKYGGPNLVHCLVKLFNAILSRGFYPSLLRMGIIVPLFKGGNKCKSEFGNYHGLTLTSVIGKVFDKIIMNRITDWCKTINFPDQLPVFNLTKVAH
jgi:hypothetical protein